MITAQMTDEEVICAWMEPHPTKHWLGVVAEQGRMPEWWAMQDGLVCTWRARTLDLVALWEVEERLLAELCLHFPYHAALCQVVEEESRNTSHDFIWHADAKQRIKALAAVLRSLVEAPK